MMKKTIRMILSLVLVLVLGAALLVACNNKGGEEPETHTYSTTWSHDASEHWHQCTQEGHTDVADKAAHTYDNDADTTCNVCGYVRAAHLPSGAKTQPTTGTNAP